MRWSAARAYPITGELIPVAKEEGSEVFAGTINEDGAFEFKATKPAADTTLARIIRMKDLSKRVLIPAFDLDNGNPDASRRSWLPKLFHNFPGPDSDGDRLAYKVALYTSAAPTFFTAASGDVSEFIPILPADVASLSGGSQAAGGQSVTLFQSLASKTDPVLHVRFPAPWSVVVQNRAIPNWRRGRDSNPRYP